MATMYVYNIPTDETVNLRRNPSTSATVLVRVPYGQAVDATYYNSTWHSATYNGYSGYMMSTYLTSTNPNSGSGSYPYTATVDTSRHGNGGSLNMRASASTSASLVTTIPNNATINVQSLSGTWLAAKYGNYTGYVMAKFIVGTSEYGSTNSGSGGGTGINTATWSEVLAGQATYRRESSNSAVCEGVKTLQQYLIDIGWGRAAVLGTTTDLTVDGNFGAKTETAVKNFQYECELDQDGIVGSQTASKLNSAHTNSYFTTLAYQPVANSEWSYSNLPSRITNVSLCARIICAEHTYNSDSSGDRNARAGVAKVLRNRKNSSVNFNEVNGEKTYKAIIFGTNQFDPATGATASKKMAYFVKRGASNGIPWQQAIEFATSLVNGATINGAPAVVNQVYFRGKTSSWTTQGKTDIVYYPSESSSHFTAFYNKT